MAFVCLTCTVSTAQFPPHLPPSVRLHITLGQLASPSTSKFLTARKIASHLRSLQLLATVCGLLVLVKPSRPVDNNVVDTPGLGRAVSEVELVVHQKSSSPESPLGFRLLYIACAHGRSKPNT